MIECCRFGGVMNGLFVKANVVAVWHFSIFPNEGDLSGFTQSETVKLIKLCFDDDFDRFESWSC